MKKIYVFWLVIWASAVYADFTRNDLLGAIVVICAGFFAIITREEVVNDWMEAYKRRSKRFPRLFPPSAITERSYNVQKIMVFVVGIFFMASGMSFFFQSHAPNNPGIFRSGIGNPMENQATPNPSVAEEATATMESFQGTMGTYAECGDGYEDFGTDASSVCIGHGGFLRWYW